MVEKIGSRVSPTARPVLLGSIGLTPLLYCKSADAPTFLYSSLNNPGSGRKVRDVAHFLETLRNVTVVLPEYAAHAAYGAVAYLKANESADAYAERQGLFVIRATGSSASITNREDFRPRTFGRRQPVARGPR